MNESDLLRKLEVSLAQYDSNNQNENLQNLSIHLRRAWDYVDLNRDSNGHLKELKDLVTKSRNRIWVDNLYLVKPIARRYTRIFPGIDYFDLEAEGNLTIFKIIKNYDFHKGPFLNYATHSIKNNIRRAISERWRTMKLPISNFPKYNKMLGYFSHDFQQRLGRFPTDKELAHLMHVSVKYVKNFKWIRKNLYHLKSLDIPILRHGKVIRYLIDDVIDENSNFEMNTIGEILKQKFIKDYISKLPDAERSVLLGQLENKTLVDIAKEKNCTREWTRQLKSRGLEKIEALEEFREAAEDWRVK